MNELPTRKKIRLNGYDYAGVGYYFVTICIKDRHELLGHIDWVEARRNGFAPPTPPVHTVPYTAVQLVVAKCTLA